MALRLSGYADRISVRPGDEINFMLSADPAAEVRTELVRLIHGDAHPGGPGHVEEPVAAAANGWCPVARQYVQSGNFLTVDDPEGRLAPPGAFKVRGGTPFGRGALYDLLSKQLYRGMIPHNRDRRSPSSDRRCA